MIARGLINPDKVAIYVRWSTEEQGKGNTKEVQLEYCSDFIKRNKWNVNPDLIFIDEGYTGANTNRPDLNRLRGHVKDGLVDCVVVYKIDRLSRKLVDTVDIVVDEWDDRCSLMSALEAEFDTTSPFGRVILQFFAMFAELEREVIRERVMGGKNKNAENGKNPGFKAPYGYTSEKGIFQVVPSEAAIVRRIFSECIQGRGFMNITNSLNTEGIKFRKGKEWNQSTIGHILENKAYTGILVYNKLKRNHKRGKNPDEMFWIRTGTETEVESEFIPPIITPEDFEAAQEAKKGRNVSSNGISGRAIASPHLLTGIAVCTCGHSLAGRKQRPKDTRSYYKCRGSINKGAGFCGASYLRQDEIDEMVINDLKNDLLNKDNRDSFRKTLLEGKRAAIRIKQNSVNDLESELATLKNRIKVIDTDYATGKIESDDYNRLLPVVKQRIATVESHLKEAQEELKNLTLTQDSNEAIEKVIIRFANFDNLQIEEKKSLLRELINRVVVYQGKNEEEIFLRIESKYPKPE